MANTLKKVAAVSKVQYLSEITRSKSEADFV